jgi:hypothetical protein
MIYIYIYIYMRLTLAECLGWPMRDERGAYAEVQERSDGGVSRSEGGGGGLLWRNALDGP